MSLLTKQTAALFAMGGYRQREGYTTAQVQNEERINEIEWCPSRLVLVLPCMTSSVIVVLS